MIKLNSFFNKKNLKDFSSFLMSANGFVFIFLLVVLIESSYLVNLALNQNINLRAAVLPSVLISETNQKRSEMALPVLTTSPLLTKAAELKVTDMATRGYFSHDTPEGKQPWYWLDQAGYLYKYAGENLAVNFNESSEVTEAWMNSPSHRSNILKTTYTEIGVAAKRGVYKGKEAVFVVQFFGTPMETKSLTKIIPEKPQSRILESSSKKEKAPVSSVVNKPSEKVLGEGVVKNTDTEKKLNTNNTLYLIIAFVAFVLIIQAILDKVKLGPVLRSLLLIAVIVYLIYLNEKVFPVGIISLIKDISLFA